MNLTALKAAVQADTFDASVDPTSWLNLKYEEIVGLEEWTFLRAVATVNITAGNSTVGSLPADFGVARRLIDQYGSRLEPIQDLGRFQELYVAGTSGALSGQPEAYTFDGTNLLVGPKPSVTTTFTLVYDKGAVPLVNGTDIPVIPTNYHEALVAGARAYGCRRYGMIGEAEEADAEYRAAIDAMRDRYTKPLRDGSRQIPAYRPG